MIPLLFLDIIDPKFNEKITKLQPSFQLPRDSRFFNCHFSLQITQKKSKIPRHTFISNDE